MPGTSWRRFDETDDFVVDERDAVVGSAPTVNSRRESGASSSSVLSWS